ncbi:histone-like nucleoid-structuring protein Lsr2 [Nocardia aurea]|uniref:histone-like nucleoid-structuring protein Lsr2 n=1 Tax=Nocardia aurea TaxID=2144174 RepID=UPI000D6896B4|nr:Lsr2 family protein [Nocardia aurea]
MARQVVVTLVDDYDGKSDAEETVSFAVDGAAYEIDLSVLNASTLRGVFERWAPHARKVGRAPRGKASRSTAAPDRQQTIAIREWARKNGHHVSSRGRLSAEIVDAYNKASTN